MSKVYLHTDTIVSPIGFTTKDNLESLRLGVSGISKIDEPNLHDSPFYGAKIDTSKLLNAFNTTLDISNYSRLELLMILALQPIFDKHASEIGDHTSLIISTTKGNIDILDKSSNLDKSRCYLPALGQALTSYFKLKENPIIVSNACISGGLALLTAQRMINSGHSKNAIVVAGDILSKFTLSGFFSFNAISPKPCKPFSKDREGINLGEATAAIFVSTKHSKVSLIAGATANDANHISGPSRTGAGLTLALKQTLTKAKLNASQVKYLSPHGTATRYNDAMEQAAFTTIGLQDAVINPIKGYYGHTLGASALIEAIICKHAILQQSSFNSFGFNPSKENNTLNISTANHKLQIDYALNTASGFGGCNLAQLLKRESQ